MQFLPGQSWTQRKMTIDLVPLSQLPSRYGIARSNLYNRIKELKIETGSRSMHNFDVSLYVFVIPQLRKKVMNNSMQLTMENAPSP